MKKGEARDAILDGLETLLAPIGFRVKRKTGELIRKTASGRQRVSFALYDYNPVFVFSLRPTVYFEAMDELYFKANGKERSDGPTWEFSISRSYLLEGLPEKFEVESVEQIGNAMEKLRPGIVGKMIPFFQQCESLAAFESIVNSGVDRCTDLNIPYNSFVHIMAAYLANRDRLDEVVSKWTPLPSIPVVLESHRQDMQKLLAYMHTSPV